MLRTSFAAVLVAAANAEQLPSMYQTVGAATKTHTIVLTTDWHGPFSIGSGSQSADKFLFSLGSADNLITNFYCDWEEGDCK